MAKSTRRKFIWLANAGIASLVIILWNKITLKHIHSLEQKERKFPYSMNQKVAFFDNYIVINHNEKLTVFSSHCTHLGCKIQNIENGRLVCPCHGSEYDLDGNAIKGPAFKSLTKVPAQLSADNTTIEIID